MKTIVFAAMASLSLAGSSCYKEQATRISVPASIKDGVKVELVDVKCHEVADSDDGRSLELSMKLAVSNGGETTLQFFPERVRILEPQPLSPIRSDTSCAIEKGERRTVWVQFEDPRGASCSNRMSLDAADSLASMERTVHLVPLAFVGNDTP